jgi:cysteine desulfurase
MTGTVSRENAMPPIYLDYNATTPLDPAVLEAMMPYLQREFGNPSSSHEYGRRSHDAVEMARSQVAALLGAQNDEIVFTGGGSEASNHAIKGTAFAELLRSRGKVHFITCAIEHPATLQPCAFLRRFGCKIMVLPVDQHGLLDMVALRDSLDHRATLVSVMHANNEVGTLQPIVEIARLAHEHGALMHTDAAQSLGKVPVDVNELGVDLLSVAGHKLYAPKGVGALYIRRGVELVPLVHGAGHEKDRRAGTENVPYIVALGQACAIARQQLSTTTARLRLLRDRLWDRLRAALGDKIVVNGHPELRLPNTLNVNFVSHVGAELLQKTPEVAASTGSACHEGLVALSPVLAAMGVPPEIGKGAVRLSVGRFTTEDEIDRAAAALIRAAARS